MLSLPIHHIGVATRSIEKEWLVFEKLGFVKEADFVDTTQGVRGEFIIPRNPHYPAYRFELLENLNGEGVLDSYLANNTKMYHIAYESKNIEADLAILLGSDFARPLAPSQALIGDTSAKNLVTSIATTGGGGDE
ncbi:hypothetical protein CQA53_03485 [Helicobacter didelphidarum]|uniref:VOC domain-containing protein n=1 Tax=Helicobacter didelphidarum TaxID=2040648 RepID=A0A3D8IMK2_9HELI|nr:VOC family protein [Helicobacter didelphidarum]RDU66517.1 hypothetical protein CQA53_03485 [Helicobacter didelphidarum]